VASRIAAHPQVATARVVALPPSQLLLAVLEREPQAVAWLGSPARPWHVDRGGTAFAHSEAGGALPEIHGVAELEPGTPQAELARAVELLGAIEARGLPAPREVWLGGHDPNALPTLRMDVQGRTRIVLLGGGPLEPRLEQLQRLLAAGRPETTAAEIIDVRFAGQVILRSGPPPDGGEAADERGGASPP